MLVLQITDIFKFPHDNGFLEFVLGILFILSLYHFLLYFQHKDKLFLLYSAYTFFILMANLIHIRNGFIYDIAIKFRKVIVQPEVYTETYYIIYFFFAYKFLDVKKSFPKWCKINFRILYFIIAYCFILVLLSVITGNKYYQIKGYYGFVVFITILGIISYIPFFKVQNPLKYYIIYGSLILFITSIISLIHYLKLMSSSKDIQSAFTILYIGFILENILFSLGLGHKQKLILLEKNESKRKLIMQLEENEKLRNEIQIRLEKEVEILSKIAKAEKVEKLKARYDKELAELKLSSLRNQMNPHFIFNSLNSIKLYIIDNEKESAVYYLNKFSKLIRKILATTREKEISLADEIETMELYVNIENIRFSNEIKFTMNVQDDLGLETIKIPSLILQPFIENAIWHGLSSKKGSKKLALNIEKENQSHIIITIIDNGIGRKKSAEINSKKMLKKSSIGLKLTEERLVNFVKDYQNNYELSFTDLFDKNNKAIGTKITLKIPIK